MIFSDKKRTLRPIAGILVLTFVCLDLAWAHPPERAAGGSTLAVPSLLQKQPVNENATRLKESLASESGTIGALCSIAKYILEERLPPKHLRSVITAELGEAAKNIEFENIALGDGIVRVPCELAGKRRLMQVVLKGSPASSKTTGRECLSSDRYVIREIVEEKIATPNKRTPKTQSEIKVHADKPPIERSDALSKLIEILKRFMPGILLAALAYDIASGADLRGYAMMGIAAPLIPGSGLNASQAMDGKTIITLSMEGNIPEFDGYDAQNANTKGGLGAYYGDKLEGMADAGIKGCGIMPLYSKVLKDGNYTDVDYSGLISKGILQRVVSGDGVPLSIGVYAWDDINPDDISSNPLRRIEVYRINRGGTTLYMLKCPEIFDVLYSDNRAHRFIQEVVFGKAAYNLMTRQDVIKSIPDIIHLNEAHTVIAAAQAKADERFDKTAIVYTNHTIVPAGLEIFRASNVRTNVDRMMYTIGIPETKHLKFRSVFLSRDGSVDFCKAAIMLAMEKGQINAVSNEHALATRELFKRMYGKEFDVKVIGVLNGSGKSWKSDELRGAEENGKTPGEKELFNIHERGKEESFKEIEKRVGIKLDSGKPTLWAVRRFVDYKSQYPILRFLLHLMCADRSEVFTKEKLKSIWYRDIPNLGEQGIRYLSEEILNGLFTGNDGKPVESINGLGMQVVVGWPQPGYMPFWAEEFERLSKTEGLKGRLVVIPDSDTRLLRMQAIGADICVNMPRPMEEACGTSDQRTGLNGGVNIAVRGAGPVEWITDYNETTGEGSGFLVDSYTNAKQGGMEPDPERFYKEAPLDIFNKARTASELFYNRKDEWKKLMYNSYLAANSKVTALAMERRYAQDVYVPAIVKSGEIRPSIDLMSSSIVTLGLIETSNWLKDAWLADPVFTTMVVFSVIALSISIAKIIKDRTEEKDLRIEPEKALDVSGEIVNEEEPVVMTPVYRYKSDPVQLEAEGGMASVIMLARKAKREDQKLLIGLETDWIPGLDKKRSLQSSAIYALIKEIRTMGDALRSMGLDNVEVISGSGNDLAGIILDRADKTHTSLHNVVVMASKDTINSENFSRLRSADELNRPFLAGIDPTDLVKLYTEFGESSSHQLYVGLTQMLYLTLQLAVGKEPPQIPIITFYDRQMRTVIFLPRAEPIDFELLKTKYAGEKAALAAA